MQPPQDEPPGSGKQPGKSSLTVVEAAPASPPEAGSPRNGDAAAAPPPVAPPPAASYFRLYAGADPLDCLLLVLGVVGALGNGVMLPLFTILFGDFTNAFGQFIPPCLGLPPIPGFLSEAGFNQVVGQLALKFLYLAIGATVAGFMQSACWSLSSVRQTNRLRRRYLGAVLRQDVTFFDTQTTTGGLLQGLSEDALAVQQAISEKVGTFLQHTATFLAGLVIAFAKGWDMTLVLVGCLPFLAGVGGVLAKLTTSLSNQATTAYTEAGAVVQQNLSQIRTVAAYGGEAAAAADYDARLDHPAKVGRRQGATAGLALGSMQFVMFCSYALALYYGAIRVTQGHMTGGSVLNVMLAALMGAFSLGMAAPNLQYFSKGASAGARLFAVMQRTPAIDPDAPGEEPASCEGAVRLEGVTFAYPARPDVTVMRGLTLDVPAGRTVALVGSSGSGKSTVVGLIERFYDPLSGSVLLDGRDIRRLKLSWLRSQVGLVSQEPTLFQTSIWENIALGRPGASDAEVRDAAAKANAARFIEAMPGGYQTQVGERGVQLSGGQKQRIAIARAILKNPRVLLLDEATSALDSESERVVQEALDRMVVGRTTVVVAHRLSTVQNADEIAVMRQGVLVERGSHAELLANPTGAYTHLVQLQMQAQEHEVQREAEVQEVLTSGGAPVTRASLERVLSRRRSLELARQSSASQSSGSTRRSTQDRTGEAAQPEELAGTPTNKDAHVLVVESPAALAAADAASKLAVQQHGPLPGALATEAAAAEAVGAGGGVVRRRGWFGRRGQVAATAAAGGADSKDGKGGAATEEPPVKVPFSRLLALNRPEWPALLLGVGSSAIVGGVQPAFAFLLSALTANFFTPDSSKLLSNASLYSWLLFAIACAVLLATAAQQFAFAVMGTALSRRVRAMLFKAMLRQEIGWFDRDENSSGQLSSALATDAAVLRGAVGDVFGVVFQNLACMGAGLAIAFIYDWRVALLVLGVAPLVALGGSLHMKMTLGASNSTDKIYATANQAVSEAVSSIRVIAAYNLQGYVLSSYAALLHAVNARNKSAAVVAGASMAYSQFIMFALYSLVIWFGGLEIAACRASFDAFLKSFLAVLFCALGLAQAQVGFPDLAKAKGALQAVFRIVDRRSAIDPSSPDGDAPDARGVRGELELRGVVFAYPARPTVKVFDNFSLQIPAGQQVALVGESGSGKSTVVGLIERFYDPLSGSVLLDGRDIRTYNVAWLRSQIGLVSQEPLLFSGSVRDNIAYACPGATLAQVEAAARAANAHEFVSALPDGYDTQVGERGMQLSGGQKQRVAIARAVLKDPKIMLLDEATSALDAASERVVQEALDRLMAGRTSVVVAHRLSTIRNAHTIAVVHRGMILEQGTHAELLAIPGGGYARLVAAQVKAGGAAPA